MGDTIKNMTANYGQNRDYQEQLMARYYNLLLFIALFLPDLNDGNAKLKT